MSDCSHSIVINRVLTTTMIFFIDFLTLVLLIEVFAAVSTPTQCQMLLSVAQKISNTLEQCRLLLLAMRKFPNLVFEHGVSNTDFLIHKCTVVRDVNAHTFIHTSSCNRVFIGFKSGF